MRFFASSGLRRGSCRWHWPLCRPTAGWTSRKCSGLCAAARALSCSTCSPDTPARTPRFHRWTPIAGTPWTISRFLQIGRDNLIIWFWNMAGCVNERNAHFCPGAVVPAMAGVWDHSSNWKRDRNVHFDWPDHHLHTFTTVKNFYLSLELSCFMLLSLKKNNNNKTKSTLI